MIDSAQHQVLRALFQLSRDTQHISATTLADAVGLTPTQTAAALVALEHAGLVDASRARLTMVGLATAVRVGPASSGAKRARRPLRAFAEPSPAPASEPLAAQPSWLPIAEATRRSLKETARCRRNRALERGLLSGSPTTGFTS
jgi:DNA-binding transcriptional ArsR family regulator